MENQYLEDRIKILEDMEALKKLKSDYAAACDRVFCSNDLEPLMKIFTEDAVWDVGDFGRYVGKEEIKECLKGIRETFVYSVHYFVNPHIDIHGDQANARWTMLCLYTNVEGQDLVAAGTEDDQYKRIDSEWFLSDMKLATQFFSPLSEGWHKIVMEKFGRA